MNVGAARIPPAGLALRPRNLGQRRQRLHQLDPARKARSRGRSRAPIARVVRAAVAIVSVLNDAFR